MGVAGFWSWFVANQGSSFVVLPQGGSVDTEHILIDMNSFFHTAARHSTSLVRLRAPLG
jgi:hypothetical protein